MGENKSRNSDDKNTTVAAGRGEINEAKNVAQQQYISDNPPL